MAQRTFTVPAGTVLPNGVTVTESIVHKITYDKSTMTPAQAQKRARASAAAEVNALYGTRVGVEDLQRRTARVQKSAKTAKGTPRARGGRESRITKLVRGAGVKHETHPDWMVIPLGKPAPPVFQHIVQAITETFQRLRPDLLQVVGQGVRILEHRLQYGETITLNFEEFSKGPTYTSLAAFQRQNPTLKAFEQNHGIEIRNSVGWFIEYLPYGTLRERRKGGRA